MYPDDELADIRAMVQSAQEKANRANTPTCIEKWRGVLRVVYADRRVGEALETFSPVRDRKAFGGNKR